MNVKSIQRRTFGCFHTFLRTRSVDDAFPVLRGLIIGRVVVLQLQWISLKQMGEWSLSSPQEIINRPQLSSVCTVHRRRMNGTARRSSHRWVIHKRWCMHQPILYSITTNYMRSNSLILMPCSLHYKQMKQGNIKVWIGQQQHWHQCTQ